MQVAARLTHLTHLARRFFGFLRARPLTPSEQIEVCRILGPELALVFFSQPPADQRHSLDVSSTVGERGGSGDQLVAALLHDVGKRDSELGAVGRALATIGTALRFPVPAKWERYRDHGERGALLLERVGAPDLAIAFARHHPGPVPVGVDRDAWHRLSEADRLAH